MQKIARNFIAIAAPSGGGKTTLCRMLLAKYPGTCLSISFTTRTPRAGEKDEVEYHFVSQEKFEKLIRNDELIEWAKVHGSYYGTSKTYLEEKCQADKVVLLDIDVQGVDSLKRVFGERCLSIFILPPNMGALERRLRNRRTDTERKIQERLVNAKAEIARAQDFDYRIVNHDLQESFAELCAIVEREVGLAE